MESDPGFSIRRLSSPTEEEIAQLADLLIDCVEGGASVSFMSPLTRERALGFWQRVAGEAAAGGRALFVAEDEQGILGTVQLVLTGGDFSVCKATKKKVAKKK